MYSSLQSGSLEATLPHNKHLLQMPWPTLGQEVLMCTSGQFYVCEIMKHTVFIKITCPVYGTAYKQTQDDLDS